MQAVVAVRCRISDREPKTGLTKSAFLHILLAELIRLNAMDVEREEYLCQKQTERNRRRLEAVLVKRMGSAPRSPAYARLTPLQVMSGRMLFRVFFK